MPPIRTAVGQCPPCIDSTFALEKCDLTTDYTDEHGSDSGPLSYPWPSVPIRGSILLRSAAAILGVVVMVTVAYAAEPTTMPEMITLGGSATSSSSGGPAPATLPFAVLPATMVSLDFTDTPIDTVLGYMSEKADYIVVKLGSVVGNMTLQSRKPVSNSDLPGILNVALEPHGFVVERMGRILKFDSIGSGGVPPVRYGDDPNQIAGNDTIITAVIPLKGLDAKLLQQAIAPLLSPMAITTINKSANDLMVTDASANARRVVQLIKYLQDAPADAGAVKDNPLASATTRQSGPATFPAAAQTKPSTTMLALSFKDASIDSVLNFVSDNSGYNVVCVAPISGRIALEAPAPVSSDDLPTLLDTALEADGYGLVPMGYILIVGDRVALAKLNFSDPTSLQFFVDPAQLPELDSFVALVMPDTNAVEIPRHNPLAPSSIVPNPNGSKTLLITGRSRDVTEAAHLIQFLNAEAALGVGMFVRHLVHADAQEAATMVNKNYPPTTTPAGGGGGTAITPEAEAQRVTISCDERSNNVVVSGPKDKLAAIQILLDKFDAPAPGATTMPTTATSGSRGGQ
jgi:type II secretory pathway component GspD/PulD (secretin)